MAVGALGGCGTPGLLFCRTWCMVYIRLSMQGGSGSSRGMRNTKQQCRISHCTHRVAYRLYNIVHIPQGARHPIYLGVIRIMTNYLLGVQYMYWGRCRLLCSIRIARGRDRRGTHMWRISISIVRPANRDWACPTERCHLLSN